MLIVGGVLVALGAILLIVMLTQRSRLSALLEATPRTVGELTGTAKLVGNELGAGGFKDVVSVSGDLFCPRPLTSPLGSKPCVMYDVTITREYEEDVQERDANNNVVRRTRKGTETLSSQSERTDFYVRDASGELLVLTEGASMEEPVQSVSRYEPGGDGGSITIGPFRIALGGSSGSRRTIGHRYVERIYPAEGAVTVIAQVSDKNGRLAAREGGGKFIVSRRSRDEMVKRATTGAKAFGAIGTILALAGVVLIAIGLIRG